MGWLAGIVSGTLMAYAVPNAARHQAHFGGSVYAWHLFGLHFSAYHGLIALCINLIVVVVATPVLRAVSPRDGSARPTEPSGSPAVPA